ncbi:MAG: TfoX/Sxy family protein [Pirellulaceae bacterium]|nr:TfoX/Sxy family protein [Pirellulaceae bacterium]
MAFSESLADRVRNVLRGRRGITEKRMFGGLAFLLRGNMCVGIWKTALIVRMLPADASALLAEPHVRPFDVTGRPMRGWLLVEPDGVEEDRQLAAWIERALDFVGTLPAK